MGQTFGKYELIERIAEGGMGEVFLARQQGIQGFEKRVVVKTLLPHLARNQDFVHMFLDEARIAAQLSHSNLVSIFDLGEQDGSYFLAMDYVHGETFSALLRRLKEDGKRLDPALACRVVAEAAAGLSYAHGLAGADGKPLGLVHRDVSPQNILISFDGAVKLIDFGVARARGRLTQTDTGVVKGKWAYMSPEQAAGDALDGRSDLFSLGVVLWEALTGRSLFRADTEAATLSAVLSRRIDPPSQVERDVPQTLDAVVLGALERAVGERYASVEAFRLALENWLAQSSALASTAHLGALMRSLFPERALPRPITLSPSPGFPATLPSPSDRTRNERRTEKVPPVEEAASTERDAARPAKRRWPLPVGLSMLALAAAGAYALSSQPSPQAEALPGELAKLEAPRPAGRPTPAPEPEAPIPAKPEATRVVEPEPPKVVEPEPPKAEPAKQPGAKVVRTSLPFGRCQPKENCFSTLEAVASARRVEPIHFSMTAEEALNAASAELARRPGVKILKRAPTHLVAEYESGLFRTRSEIAADADFSLLHVRLVTTGQGNGEISRRWLNQYWVELAARLKSP